jgi:two-component system OmpR family response regulator
VDVIVLADEPTRRDAVVTALRASGFEAEGARPDDDLPGEAGLVVLIGHDEQASSQAAAAQLPVLAMPTGWSTAAQVRTSTEAAGSVLGRSDQLPSSSAIVVGDLVVEEDAHAVYRNGSPIDLTHREFLLLTMLARHPNRVLNREVLMDRLWGHEAVTPNTIEVHISSLRRKLETHGPRLIFTVRRVGYVLRTDSSRTIAPGQAERQEPRQPTSSTSERTIVLPDNEAPVPTIDVDDESRQRTPLGL